MQICDFMHKTGVKMAEIQNEVEAQHVFYGCGGGIVEILI